MSETAIWRMLVAIAAALLLIGNSSLWVDRSLADRDTFVETAVEAFEQEEAREDIAEEIVFALMGNQPFIYQLAGGAAELAVTSLLATPALQPLLNLIATQFHRMVVAGERPTVTIGTEFLAPITDAITDVLGPGSSFAFQVPEQEIEIDLFGGRSVPSLEPIIDPLTAVGWLCGAAGLVILVLSIVVSSNRPRALRRVALALLAVMVVTLLAIVPLRRLYLSRIEDATARTISSDVLGALTFQLALQTLLLLVAGAILWAISLWKRGTLAQTPENQPVEA